MFGPDGPSFWELARQALSSTVRGYDLLAPKFDRTPFRTPDPVLATVAAQLQPVEQALDLCCGTGAGLCALDPLCQRLTGLDFSPGMLAVAARACPRARLVLGDARRLEFHQEFDLITCFGAFGHILPREEPAFVRGLAAALRPGGSFVFVTAYPSRFPWQAWAFNGLMRLRNLLWRPAFIMYYLTFLLPDCRGMLEAHGLRVRERAGLFTGEFGRLVLVTATKGEG